MHLLVETNFLVELMLGQDQVAACERILQAAEQSKFALHIPAFSLMESVYRLVGQEKEYGELQDLVQRQLGQAEREVEKRQELQQLKRQYATLLEERNLRQQDQLMIIGTRVATVTQQIPLTAIIWQQVQHLRNTTRLTQPDAFIVASLLHRIAELPHTEKLIISRDKKAFRLEEVRQLFEEEECEVLLSFEHACQRLKL